MSVKTPTNHVQAIQTWSLFLFFLFWNTFFGCLDPDPASRYRSGEPIESGSNPDPRHWFTIPHRISHIRVRFYFVSYVVRFEPKTVTKSEASSELNSCKLLHLFCEAWRGCSRTFVLDAVMSSRTYVFLLFPNLLKFFQTQPYVNGFDCSLSGNGEGWQEVCLAEEAKFKKEKAQLKVIPFFKVSDTSCAGGFGSRGLFPMYEYSKFRSWWKCYNRKCSAIANVVDPHWVQCGS